MKEETLFCVLTCNLLVQPDVFGRANTRLPHTRRGRPRGGSGTPSFYCQNPYTLPLISLLLFTSPNYHSDSSCFTFCNAVSEPGFVSKLLNWKASREDARITDMNVWWPFNWANPSYGPRPPLHDFICNVEKTNKLTLFMRSALHCEAIRPVVIDTSRCKSSSNFRLMFSCWQEKCLSHSNKDIS